ncbi:SnoaL-4 domain containing protein, partial [Pyrenophora tritici-repentis]
VVDKLRCAASKIHISFDGWTVKGGKRGFFGIVAHFATAKGDLRDVAINLPQLLGAYTSDRIANCVAETLQKFNITAQNVGYFMLDNAFNNDTAIATLRAKFSFNLNKDAFNNDENLAEEEKYLNE